MAFCTVFTLNKFLPLIVVVFCQSLKNVHSLKRVLFIAATMDDTENDIEYPGGKRKK